jgi:hypothetical protein
MVIYPAAKSRHHGWLSALQAAGVPFQASWLTWRFNLELDEEPSQEDWAQHVEVCLREAREADAVLLYAQLDDRPHFGAIMEAAAALSNGKQCFLVSPHPWEFLRHHPRCRSFETMAAAISAIMAQCAGEQARVIAQLAGERGRAA